MTARHRNLDQMKELFRRMVFNILVDNTDDHEKNHVVLMNAKGEYELSPAFDVLRFRAIPGVPADARRHVRRRFDAR